MQLLLRLLAWVLAGALVVVLPGAALKMAGPFFGFEAQGHMASSPLLLPNVALAVAKPHEIQEVGIGDRIVTGDGLFQILMVRREAGSDVILAARERDGATLSLASQGEVMLVEMLIPYLGYGAARGWEGTAALAVPLGLSCILLLGVLVRPFAREGHADQPSVPQPGAYSAPQEEFPLFTEGEWPVEGEGEANPTEASAPTEDTSQPPQEVPAPQAATSQDGLQPDLRDLFRKVSQQVRERTLAAEVEDVDLSAILSELESLRRAIGIRRGKHD